MDEKEYARKYYLEHKEKFCANCNWIKRYENDETPNKFYEEVE